MSNHALLLLAVACTLALGPAAAAQARDRSRAALGPHLRVRPVDAADVRWTDGFWAEKFALCRDVMLPGIREALGDPGNAAILDNFRVAAKLKGGKHQGTDWSDGDCYKWLEAVAHVYQATRDEKLARLMDEWIAVIAKAQDADGYLSTNIQLTHRPRLANPHHHELYNMGHLLTAACVHHRATGKDSFLSVARKLGDFLYRTFQPRPPELAHFGWNPSNIMGLVDLYRATGDRKYLELAGIFVSMRGSAPGGSDLTQDHVPLRQETMAVGHCVCATYLYSGAADVYAETGEEALRAALERIWGDMMARRMYLTGAIGSFRQGKSPRGDSVHEAFGGDYELPPRTAYNETCSNLGNAMWSRRMFAITGEARYADLVERVLHNSALSAVSVDGTGYFYCNPLAWGGEKQGPSMHHTARRWSVHRCFCCPPQVARTIAKLRGWAYGVSAEGLWVHLYGGGTVATTLPDGPAVGLTQQTDYPWDGRVRLTVDKAPAAPLAIRLRIPAWAAGATIRVNGQGSRAAAKPGTYAALTRTWAAGDAIELDLPMPARLVEAHPDAADLRGKVAVMRGPVVYCLESPDLPEGTAFGDVAIPASIELVP
ncbi:MAG TPA: glycoside hydrolase family 127 protein, partial [Phycisphaerae bacterium]|nr:glycoside hydrolase family 127 protein [Phycisphaerae bacterium]